MTAPGATAARTPRLPGVEGIWALIGADSVVFAVLFGAFMNDRRRDPGLFETSRLTLDSTVGGIDTLILLTSSWTVALAIQAIRRDDTGRVPRYLLAGVITGAVFMVSKATEYAGLIADGITPATNSFFMWYFILTGMHLFHVVLGTGLLSFLWTRSRRRAYGSSNPAVPESVATFWHLVDLLWIVLFPLLYLMKAAA